MIFDKLAHLLAIVTSIFHSGVQEPSFQVLEKSKYIASTLPVFTFELRQYSSVVTASVQVQDK